MFARPDSIISQFKLGEETTVADLGVGSGVHAIAMARAVGKGGRVYACDIRKELLAKVAKDAREAKLDTVHVIWADLEQPHGTTLKDGLCHAVLVSNILFQIENREVLMKEVERILRPGGKALIVDWKDSFGGTGPHADSVFGKQAARTLAEQSGLTFEQDIDAGSHHYGMLFRKAR